MSKIRLNVVGSQIVGASVLGDSLNSVNGQICSLDIKESGDYLYLTWADLEVVKSKNFKELEALYVKLLRKQAVIIFKNVIEITNFYN